MAARLFITSIQYVTTNKKQTDIWCTYETALQFNRLFNITVTCDQVKHVHISFSFSVRDTRRHIFKSLQAKVKQTTHSKGVVMGKDHKTVYCLNPAGFAHSRLAESFNETHPVIFPFLLKAHELTGLTFPLPFLASVSFNYPELNQRQESTPEWNVTVWQHRN